MTSKTTNRLLRLPAAASLLLLFCITGCASRSSADLKLTSLEGKATFRQQFTDAYIAKGADGGDTEVVLAGRDGDVRQVMHVKVLWRPSRGTKQSHPSYTNAGLHWYVMNHNGSDAPDVLEYTGAGFVVLSNSPLAKGGADGTRVTIRNATLKPVETPGAATTMKDPVGPAKLTGSFVAKRSPKRVNDLLAEVRSATDGARAQQASAQ